MEDLWNLQTLIISTQQETLNIEADICSMPQLRHLHTNASAKLCPSVLKTRNHHSALQTLSIIEPETFTEYVLFARCQNLKKLGIRGDMAKLVGLFELEYLEKLKLMNLASEGLHIRSENLFPRRLKQLTLSGTWFDWNEIRRVVGYLELLEVFKVKENAFTGHYWELNDYVFPCLKVLWIERSELVNWKASDENFPSLERLILRNLNKLGGNPYKLCQHKAPENDGTGEYNQING
uniref:Putative ovule protein n=1 Tax=Solanum chacoense TaxID=4108 RepID=A0A0V0HHL8_SOLCH